MQTAWQVLNDLKARGSVAQEDWAARVMASHWGAVEINRIVRGAKVREIEERCLPGGAQRNYGATWGHESHLGYEGGLAPGKSNKGGGV